MHCRISRSEEPATEANLVFSALSSDESDGRLRAKSTQRSASLRHKLRLACVFEQGQIETFNLLESLAGDTLEITVHPDC